jgi:hypothetical protein
MHQADGVCDGDVVWEKVVRGTGSSEMSRISVLSWSDPRIPRHHDGIVSIVRRTTSAAHFAFGVVIAHV